MSKSLEHFKGKFITFEGIEGVGKTTHLEFVASKIEASGIEVVTTREPGGTEIAEAIRSVLLSHYEETMVDDTEMLLLFASRAQHVARVIKPALEAGKCVLSDRFTDASYAYQGGGRGIALSRIAELENWVQGNLRPDLTFVFDAPAEVGLRRARGRGDIDRIEQEEMVFFERVRKVYLERASSNPSRYRIVEASQPLNDVQKVLTWILEEDLSLV